MIFQTNLKYAALVFFGLFLTACQSTTHPAAKLNTAEAIERATQVSNYHPTIEFEGRIFVQYEENSEKQNTNGNVLWQQNPDTIKITLSSPLGQTVAEMTQTKKEAVLIQSKKEKISSDTLENLMTQNLGWSLPVTPMKTWLQAFIMNSEGKMTPIVRQDDITIENQGWKIHYINWSEVEIPHPHHSNKQYLPKRINLSRHAPEVGDLQLRLVIDEWRIPTPPESFTQ